MTYGFNEDNEETYWLGGEPSYKLTLGKILGLRIEIWDVTGTLYTAEFSFFGIGDASMNFWLNVGQFLKGSAGDGRMSGYSAPLATMDNDITNTSCTDYFTRAWWFRADTFEDFDSCVLSVLVPNPEIGIKWLTLPKAKIKATLLKARYVNAADGKI